MRRATYHANRVTRTTHKTLGFKKKGVPPRRSEVVQELDDPRALLRAFEKRPATDDGYLWSTLPTEAVRRAQETGYLRIPGRRPVKVHATDHPFLTSLLTTRTFTTG